MKLVLLLIKILGCFLCGALFLLFIYYTIIQQQTMLANDNLLANFTLLLFVISMLVFALGEIWLENIPFNTQNTETNDSLQQYIDSIKQEKTQDIATTNQQNDLHTQLQDIRQFLQRIAGTDVKTYKTLHMGLENLSNRLDKIENIHLHNSNTSNDEDYDEEENMALLHQPILDHIFNQELAKAISDLDKQPEKKIEDINIDNILGK